MSAGSNPTVTTPARSASVTSVFELANLAIARKSGIEALVKELATDRTVDYADLLTKGQVMAPLEHPEPARFFITGTGLTHIGSAPRRATRCMSPPMATAPRNPIP